MADTGPGPADRPPADGPSADDLPADGLPADELLADDLLVGRLRGVAAEADGLPPGVLAAARAAFGLRGVDAELADLVADSFETAHLVRGPSVRRLLAWAAGTVSVDVEVSGTGPARRLVGTVEGAGGPVTVESAAAGRAAGRPADPVTLELDDAGRFSVDGVPGGPVRLRVTRAGARAVITAWVVV